MALISSINSWSRSFTNTPNQTPDWKRGAGQTNKEGEWQETVERKQVAPGRINSNLLCLSSLFSPSSHCRCWRWRCCAWCSFVTPILFPISPWSALPLADFTPISIGLHATDECRTSILHDGGLSIHTIEPRACALHIARTD